MEAFGDAVVFGEAPHADDLLRPGGEGSAELLEVREVGVGQFAQVLEPGGDQLAALARSARESIKVPSRSKISNFGVMIG